MPEASRGQTTWSPLPTVGADSAPKALRMNGESSRTSFRIVSTNQAASAVKSAQQDQGQRKENEVGQRDKEEQLYGATYTRRYNTRYSRGFLVGSLPTISVRDGANGREIHSATNLKGKAREVEPDLRLRRSKTRQPGHRSKPSIGSSPLSTEVTRVTPLEDHGLHGTSIEPQIQQHEHRSQPDHHAIHKNHSVTRDTTGNLLSLDTDPTQIVNLALNLSESRRRHVSAGRLSSIDSLGSNRRFLSSGLINPGYLPSPAFTSAGGSLKHLLQQRRDSSNLSPRSGQFERKDINLHTDKSAEIEHSIDCSSPVAGFDGQAADHLAIEPSDATLLRASRARIALELSYEYRRLLQYLPKLPIPPKSRPGTTKGVSKVTHDGPQVLGRVYNPLQYVRNRKVRGRERQTLDAEADGWKELDDVRDWVNMVANQREVYVYKLGEEKPLPTFRLIQERHEENNTSPLSSIPRSNLVPVSKPTRPRSDWKIASWDLLADSYWLELGDHRKMAEDRDGHKIFVQAAIDLTQVPRSSQELSRLPDRRSESIPRPSHTPEKRAHAIEPQDSTKERGRQRHRLRDSIVSVHEYSSSQDRKSRWHRKLIRPQSSSSSEDSLQGSLSRQSRLRGSGSSRERQDSAVLERQIMDLLAEEAGNVDKGLSSSNAEPSRTKDEASKAGSPAPISNGTEILPEDAEQSPNRSKTLLTKSDCSRDHVTTDSNRSTSEPRISLDGFDSTAPSSPTNKEAVPNISMNLSTPPFRSSSPRKPLPFQHRALNFGSRKDREKVDEADFAVESPTTISKVQSESYQRTHDFNATDSLTDGFLSPRMADTFGKVLRHGRSDTKPQRTTIDQREPDMKLRSLLSKGGNRLVGLVSSPVTKVSDLLWRRDGSNPPPTTVFRMSSYPSETSETDEDFHASDSSPMQPTLSTDDLSDYTKASSTITTVKPVTYHFNNLPNFRQQPKKGEECDNTQVSSYEDDHITRQRRKLRDRGRSRGLDRIAPPTLNITSASRQHSPSLMNIETHGISPTDESRRPSQGPSALSRRPSSNLVSGILGLPENIGHGGLPITGLANVDIRRHLSTERTEHDSERRWSIADYDVSTVHGKVTQRDLTRVKALLLSSGVKAREILRHFNRVPDPLPSFLKDLEAINNLPFPSLPRSLTHVYATRLLLQAIDEHNVKLRQAADNLSHKSIDSFHQGLRSLESRISADLTPLVRSTADDADALNTDLASSYRLGVKQLNDSIDQILRRKRRRFRWVRNGGYLLLEWVLLGAMWWVWFIVVIIRLMTGVLRGLWNLGKWLIWL